MLQTNSTCIRVQLCPVLQYRHLGTWVPGYRYPGTRKQSTGTRGYPDTVPRYAYAYPGTRYPSTRGMHTLYNCI